MGAGRQKPVKRRDLELHPDKTRRVELYDGKQGFDLLGCHLHERLSGKLCEEAGNAAKRFNQVDAFVWRRLPALRVKRKGRHSKPGDVSRWSRDSLHKLGLHRLRGTVQYSRAYLPQGVGVMLHHEKSPVSRVREIRMHGLKGRLALSSVTFTG